MHQKHGLSERSMLPASVSKTDVPLCSCAGLAILQMVFGLMRPDSGTKAHGSWFWMHSNLGRAVCLSGITNVFIGTLLMHDIQVGQRGDITLGRGGIRKRLIARVRAQIVKVVTY